MENKSSRGGRKRINAICTVALSSNSDVRNVNDSDFIISTKNGIMSAVNEVKDSLWQMGNKIRELLEELRHPMLHSGRTDNVFGHNDTENVSGLGSYHFHHEEAAHPHPDGICPYWDTGSLIQELRSYDGVRLLTKKITRDEKESFVFEADIPFGNEGKVLRLEIEGGLGSFYIYPEQDAIKPEDFFSPALSPVRIVRETSPWKDDGGGVV